MRNTFMLRRYIDLPNFKASVEYIEVFYEDVLSFV